MQCYHEKHKWLIKTADTAPVCKHVDCIEEDGVELVNGVFLCAVGTAIFDGRFVCANTGSGKPVLVAWQDKHSQLGSDGTMKAQFILE